ncbi:hypothetical protein [Micromonospora taraxaci]|uniref:hypothetical protein n=1 Tax=Micromonospora taraxaci TaxID=1316803 RepID=UPI0033A4811E
MELNFQNYTSLGSPQIAWSAHADEFFHRVQSALASLNQNLSANQIRYDGTTHPFIMMSATTTQGEAKEGSLLIAQSIDGPLALFVGHNDPQDEMVEFWKAAVDHAIKSLGQEDELYEWSAVVGAPPIRIGGTEPFLLQPGNIAHFQLRSAEQSVREITLAIELPSFSSASRGASLPILVRGSSRGYSWPSASKTAARDLNQLCALLSVAWETCLVVRDSPAPIEWGERVPPEKVFWQNIPDLPDDPPFKPQPHAGRTIPDWADDAWTRIIAIPRLADAISAHHEGLRARTEHPSLALVAFIASIEAISQLLYREDRCTECRAHLHIAAKFRKTLRLVLDDDAASELEKAYSSRSLTVHRGRLHGTETITGSFTMHSWSRDSASEFQWQVLHNMSVASARLLRIVIQGEVPQKSQFIPGTV